MRYFNRYFKIVIWLRNSRYLLCVTPNTSPTGHWLGSESIICKHFDRLKTKKWKCVLCLAGNRVGSSPAWSQQTCHDPADFTGGDGRVLHPACHSPWLYLSSLTIVHLKITFHNQCMKSSTDHRYFKAYKLINYELTKNRIWTQTVFNAS